MRKDFKDTHNTSTCLGAHIHATKCLMRILHPFSDFSDTHTTSTYLGAHIHVEKVSEVDCASIATLRRHKNTYIYLGAHIQVEKAAEADRATVERLQRDLEAAHSKSADADKEIKQYKASLTMKLNGVQEHLAV